MEIGLDRSIRNCGNQYPNSHWAKKGYEIGPVRIKECPKTFVTFEARALLDAYDASKSTGMNWFPSIGEAPASYIDLAETVEKERSLIKQGRDEIRRVKEAKERLKDSHGKL